MKKAKNLFKKKHRYPLSTRLLIVGVLVIPVTCFLVFGIYANFGGLLMAFQNFDRESEKVIFTGLQNFKKFFALFDKYHYGKKLLVSLGYFIVVFFISTPLSTIVAFFLHKKVPFSRLYIVLLFLPNIIPMSFLGEYYRQLFDPLNGILNKFFNFLLGFTPETAPSYLSDPNYANIMLYIYTIYFGFGYNALLIWGAMSRVSPELVEASRLDGCNTVREFFHVTIPSIWLTLSMILALTFTVPFTIYMQPLIITFNGQAETTTISLLSIQQLTIDPYYAACISVMLGCISFPLVLLVKKGLSKFFTTK